MGLFLRVDFINIMKSNRSLFKGTGNFTKVASGTEGVCVKERGKDRERERCRGWVGEKDMSNMPHTE